ncbi:MAG: hypothetical protein V4487_06235 [Chlamydiota bacterium]
MYAPIPLSNPEIHVVHIPAEPPQLPVWNQDSCGKAAHCFSESVCMLNECMASALTCMGCWPCTVILIASSYLKCRFLPPIVNLDRINLCPSPSRFCKVYLLKGIATATAVAAGFTYGYLWQTGQWRPFTD